MAYVGASAFSHKGGLHVSAIKKNPKTYEHVDPELVGNHRNIIVSNQAGRAHAGTGDPHYKAGYIPEAGALADSFCNLTVWIPNYSDTTAYKQGFLHNSQQYNSNYLFGNVMTACLFLDDAAIHTIKLFPLSGSFAQYSSFTIYGINGV